MKINSLDPDIPLLITMINAKTVLIKKVLSMKDLLELKQKKLTLKKAFLIGETLYVENN